MASQIVKLTYDIIFSFTSLYIIARFMLFLWIFYFSSVIGCLEMLWLFYSLIDDDDSRTIKTVRLFLCPLLTIQFLICYILNIINANPDKRFGLPVLKNPIFDVTFQLATIFLFFYLTRSIRKMIKKQAKTNSNTS